MSQQNNLEAPKVKKMNDREKETDNPQDRLISLDAFRGITMILLISFGFGLGDLEGFSGFVGWLSKQFTHSQWVGLHIWDLVQPFFMFIVGVAMPYSLMKRRRKGQSDREIFGHVVRRSLILIFLGVVIIKPVTLMEGDPYFVNVLTQIGFTYFFTFLIFRKSLKAQIITTIVILLAYDLAFRFIPLPYDVGLWVPGKNLGSYIDMVLGLHLPSGYWVTINAISTTAHTMWGAIAGWILMSNRKNTKKLQYLIIAGILTLVAGYGLSYVTPIIKRIATSTFVLASGGYCFLALAFLYWLVDIKGYKEWTFYVNVVGMNSIFIYMIHVLLGAWLINYMTIYLKPLEEWLGIGIPLIATNLSLLILWYLCYWMYKRKIFIKV